MTKLLFKSGIRYLYRNPWQSILSIVGIALGVAIVVAIDLSNESSAKAFDLSMESISGSATHNIKGTTNLPDSIFRIVRKDLNISKSAPVIEKLVVSESIPKITFTLLGIDPISEAHFRPYLANSKSLGVGIDAFITTKNAVMITKNTAAKLKLNVGDSLKIRMDGDLHSLYIITVLTTNDKNSSRALDNIIVCDIGNAQNICRMNDRLTHIDLIINDNDAEKLSKQLPKSVRIGKTSFRTKTAEQITDAFKTNLLAMSLLALIVGMFLIFNTMTFAVVQRRRYIGLIRAIGVTRREVFTLIIGEALLIGFIGTILGLILGYYMGIGLVALVTNTINDMYFVLSVKDVEMSSISIIKGFFLGIIATIVSALKPAYEATVSPPTVSLNRSHLESNLRKKIPIMNIYGIISIAVGVVILLIDSKSIYVSYLGIVPLIVGFTLFTPAVIVIAVNILTIPMSKAFGTMGKMATRGVSSHISRTTIAIAALSISVASAVGVGTMVESFRTTVIDWLTYRLRADVYVSVPTNIARWNDGVFSPEIAEEVRKFPETDRMNLYREFQITSNDKIIHILAAKVQGFSYEKFTERYLNEKELWKKFYSEDVVLVSESYAYNTGQKVNDFMTIPTDFGDKKFKIIGIYRDYSSDIGLVMLSTDIFHKYFNDRMLSGFGVFAKPGTDIEKLIQKINLLAKPNQKLVIRSNKMLLESSIEVFDRTFLITNVLQLLAIGISFIGILSSLMALQLERSRELGVLRANGLTPGQLWKLVTIQTGLMGIIAGIMSIPLGNIIAYILIFVINRRSFGWSIDFFIIPEMLLQALLISLVAALLAGIYPAYKMSRTSPALALRQE